jgi:hypothetical protein
LQNWYTFSVIKRANEVSWPTTLPAREKVPSPNADDEAHTRKLLDSPSIILIGGLMKNAFETSGTSPTEIEPDFRVENHGTIFLLQPLSPAANSWIEENLPEDRMTFGGAVVIEHRYIADIVRGAMASGLGVQ